MDWILLVTIKPRFNEPLFNAVVGITNDFLYPNNEEILCSCSFHTNQRKANSSCGDIYVAFC